MHYIKLLFEILLYTCFSYFFIRMLYDRIKLYTIRKKLKEQGLIDKKVNILPVLLFWFIPVKRFGKTDNDGHKKQMKKINYYLLGMLITIVLFFLFENILK